MLRLHNAMIILLLLSLSLIGPGASPVAAQADPAAKPVAQDPLPKAKFKPDDIKKIEKIFDQALENEDVASKHKLSSELDDFAKKNKTGSALADTQAWSDMRYRFFRSSLGKKNPAGRGRIVTEKIELNRRGEIILFEYSYCLPKKYTHDKSWPVLLCFHDKAKGGTKYSDGKTYIKKVWQGTKELKAIADNFIIIAPTIADKSLKGKVRKQKASQVRFDWFSPEHALAMIRPLTEIRKSHNCDPNRIYVEGVGHGGEIAIQLASLYGGETFAACVARSAQPRKLELLGGLKGVPTMFAHREVQKSDGSGVDTEFWNDVKTVADRDGVEGLTFLTKPPVEKLTPKLLAGQNSDPLLDATTEIADFLLSKSMSAYPEEIRITSDNRNFVKRAYLRLNQHDISEGKIVECTLKVDKKKNSINVVGTNFYAFTISLNDDILDLDRPIEIYVNGNMEQRATAVRELNFMIRQMKRPLFAFNRIFTTYIKVEVTPESEKDAEAEGGDGSDKGK